MGFFKQHIAKVVDARTEAAWASVEAKFGPQDRVDWFHAEMLQPVSAQLRLLLAQDALLVDSADTSIRIPLISIMEYRTFSDPWVITLDVLEPDGSREKFAMILEVKGRGASSAALKHRFLTRLVELIDEARIAFNAERDREKNR